VSSTCTMRKREREMSSRKRYTEMDTFRRMRYKVTVRIPRLRMLGKSRHRLWELNSRGSCSNNVDLTGKQRCCG
jgi:hypothetical protein